MLTRLLEKFYDQNKIHSLEGARGVANVSLILRAIGYDAMFTGHEDVIADFLADNPGACEALVNWISEQNVPEWKERLERRIAADEE